MTIEQLLVGLDLQDKEPEIYITLLKIPGAQPASVIATKSNLNRTTVYKTLVNLVKKGLVVKTQRHGTTCFFAEEVEKKLENTILYKKQKIDLLQQNLLTLMPDIKNLQKYNLTMPKMRSYEGANGIKRIYEDTLLVGEDIYAFEDYALMNIDIREYVSSYYLPRRVKKGIRANIITPDNPDCVIFKKMDKKYLRETRFLSPDIFHMGLEINIYGKKIAFFSTNEDEKEMFAVILENEIIAKSMKTIFDVCWQIAK